MTFEETMLQVPKEFTETYRKSIRSMSDLVDACAQPRHGHAAGIREGDAWCCAAASRGPF